MLVFQKNNSFFVIPINSLDHQVQSSSGATEIESPQNTTKVNAANEKAVSAKVDADDQPEDETCTAELTDSFNAKVEFRALFSGSVGPNIDDNHRSNAKKGGEKSRNKSKIVGIVESHEQSEGEKILLEEMGK